MRSIDCGETFIVTRNGVPIATLSPLHSARFTKAAAAIAAFRGVAPTDFVRFRADLDAHIDEDPTPRA